MHNSDLSIDWWPSPAKLNLFLHVCGQFDNGYHELQTLFQILDVGDELGFIINTSGNVVLKDNIKGVASADNLIVKAATLLLEHRQNKRLGVDIYLQKRLPMGGGLGGGSSNAATTLCALNQLWKCGLSQSELASIGLRLGADVPLFVNGHTAFAQGVGERLDNATLKAYYYLVATPHIEVSTAQIFKHPKLPRSSPKINFNEYTFDSTRNDCEILVCNQHPEVANLLNRLLHYAPSRMTGTGASVFAQFSSIEDAIQVQKTLPNDINTFVARGLNQSPLLKKLR